MRKPMKLALTLLLAACQPDAVPESPIVRADSAGVEVVQTNRPRWDAETVWTVDPAPEVRIGLLEGELPYLFSNIAGVVVLTDGTIVVADGQSREVRFFDRSGRFQRAVGGEGEGPGEFDNLASLYKCGGGLYTHDLWQRRITVWSLEGDLERTFVLNEPGTDRGPYGYRCGPGGSFVVAGWGSLRGPPARPGASFDLYAQPAPLWLLDEEGQLSLELGEYVSSERLRMINPLRGSGPHPFGRSVVYALGADHIFIGSAERLEVEVYDRSGRLLRIMRGPDDELGITDSFLAEYRSAQLSGIDSVGRAQLEEAGMLMPPAMPAFTYFLLDTEGNLWVKRFHPPWEEGNRWGVFSPDGEFYGDVDMPIGLEVMDITVDYVLGVTRDDLDVERVELLALRRPAVTSPKSGNRNDP